MWGCNCLHCTGSDRDPHRAHDGIERLIDLAAVARLTAPHPSSSVSSQVSELASSSDDELLRSFEVYFFLICANGKIIFADILPC